MLSSILFAAQVDTGPDGRPGRTDRGDPHVSVGKIQPPQLPGPDETIADTAALHSDSIWHRYQWLIYRIGIVTGLLLLASLIWNACLRRQIKHRQKAERALGDQFEFMQAWVNGTPHPIYVRDREGLLQNCNDSYLQVFAVQREDVIGKSVLQNNLLDEHEARQYHADCQQVMADGTPLIIDRPLHVGEQAFTIYHWILPYRDSTAEVKGIIGGWIDISERRQLTDQLRAAKKQADTANRAKSTFLATVSHEIRTPMNAIIGMLELTLKRSEQEQFDRPAIEVAYNAARDLLELIGDVLDIARIESGRMPLVPGWVELQEVIESVIRVFEGLARLKNLDLVLEFSPTTQATEVCIDPLRFKQVLSNLVSNAIKFTEQGQVRVLVDLQPEDPPRTHRLRLQVVDSGIGISEQDQQTLFQPFTQANSSKPSGRSGAGLGLVISRHLCEMMGADLTLSSKPGTGTRVSIDMKMPGRTPQPAPEPVATAVQHGAAGLHVLIVDDHPASCLLMCQQLDLIGHRASHAQNGADGYQAWLNGHFDLLIVDCNMPRMNGYELTRAIRRIERREQRSPCTVLGFTANAQLEERQRCIAAGMNDCLFKPVSLSALSQKLAGLTPRPRAPVFNVDTLRTLTQGDSRFALRMLTELLRCSRKDRQELLALSCEKGRQRLLEVAHKIKGSALMAQARTLKGRSNALEQACIRNVDDEQLEQCRAALEHAMLEFEQAVQEQIDQHRRPASDARHEHAGPV